MNGNEIDLGLCIVSHNSLHISGTIVKYCQDEVDYNMIQRVWVNIWQSRSERNTLIVKAYKPRQYYNRRMFYNKNLSVVRM